MSSMITRLLTSVFGSSSHQQASPAIQALKPPPIPVPAISPVEIVPQRVLELFSAHKIDVLTAAEILRVPFVDMTPGNLGRYIDNVMIDWLVKVFSVNRSWLLGESDRRGAYPLTWYKSFQDAGRHLLDRASEPDVTKIRVLFLSPESWDLKAMMTQEKGRHEFVVVIELTRQTTSGHLFQTFDRFQDMLWNDEVTRAYVLALGIFCDLTEARDLFPYNKRPSWQGLAIPDAEMMRFMRHGSLFPAELLETRAGFGSATKLYNFFLGPDEEGVSAKEFSEAKAKAEGMMTSLTAEAKRKLVYDTKMSRIKAKPDFDTDLDSEEVDAGPDGWP